MPGCVDIEIKEMSEFRAELQEMKKAIWYLKFLAAYVANGNKPIFVKDIEKLLA